MPLGTECVRLLAILDDDEDRLAEMRRLVSAAMPDIVVRHFDNAPDLLAALPALLSDCALLSLDHDLGPTRERDGERFDPGIGRAISKALAAHPATCPVIVHTSNAPAGDGMVNDLAFAQWHVLRVVPHSDLGWIREDWLPAVTKVLDGWK